ncbi:hypothetical protein MLD38_015726 [Melastoma candidum]|uniref:Uncharacterized protein n=1 Tax=Melastoma candidum TaxID=119954 RepID=A0ACB9RK52_9MYRT|nr:hypothetical protein MLD38_015726 [Melastoma candidum]
MTAPSSPPLPSSSSLRSVVLKSSAPARPTLAFSVKILFIKKPLFASRSSSVLVRAKNSSSESSSSPYSSARYNSLKVLEWDKLCDSVSSFAGTSLGREATRRRLWSLSETYEESVRLLEETDAAVQMHQHGGFNLDFSGIDAVSNLQLSVRAVIKEDSDWYSRFMPLTEAVLDFQGNQPLVKLIQRIVDEDGLVKDSASPLLKRTREQIRLLEKKLHQLMDHIIRKEADETSFLEIANVNGRWYIRSGVDKLANLKGLLVSSGTGNSSLIEPLSAVPLNDELQMLRASETKAEEEVLLMLTKKLQVDLEGIEKLLNNIIQLDVVNARARYGLSYGGTCPELFQLKEKTTFQKMQASLSDNEVSNASTNWTLYLPKAYHPLMLQQHREKLKMARKQVTQATLDVKRRNRQPGLRVRERGKLEPDLLSLEEKVNKLEQAPPIPVDFFIAKKTRVLVITGPNTGGKTVCLKTVGLSALMAKSGLYVLSAESVKLPWFDSVFADIGDEQSLTQSLSTFSGHLKQISGIQSELTMHSLVLLDEVGAGTNPLEGAALGMSLLEFFSSGALLTIATTHHGELKTLKYSAEGFENACMEFDDVNLKPTYKMLWGIPGRSNAINIAERLGLPGSIINNARELYGTDSTEINEVITDMEKLKQKLHGLQHDSEHYRTLSKDFHEKNLVTKMRIEEHRIKVRRKMFKDIADAATIARLQVRKKAHQVRASKAQPLINENQRTGTQRNQESTKEKGKGLSEATAATRNATEAHEQSKRVEKNELPQVGAMVQVASIGRKATVLKVDPVKKEMLVQAGNMKLKVSKSRTHLIGPSDEEVPEITPLSLLFILWRLVLLLQLRKQDRGM